jgi:RNA polymerase sigma-70 factor (ECF subfamily)
MNHEESSRLLRRAKGGSGEALNALFEECGEPVLAYIRLRLGARLRGQLESGDILQSTLFKAFENIEQFEGSSTKSLLGWLVSIARNQIRDEVAYHQAQRRDAARTVPISGELEKIAAEIRSEVSRIHGKEKTRRLERALESLKVEHFEVILLRKYEELTFPEIGERLGKSADACRMLYARAMTALTRKIQEIS